MAQINGGEQEEEHSQTLGVLLKVRLAWAVPSHTPPPPRHRALPRGAMSKEWAIKIKTVDMEEKPLAEGEKTMVDFSTDTAKEAMLANAYEQDVASYIKNAFDKKYGCARALSNAAPPRRLAAPPPPAPPPRTRENPAPTPPACTLRSGTWHVVVGENYATNVVHATKHFIFFYIGPKAILIFKSG